MVKRILLFDSGKEWGGGTNSMIELLKRIDRNRFEITPLFFDNYARGTGSNLRQSLAEIGLRLELLPRQKQPLWAKLAKELVRGLLAWSPSLRSGVVFLIERIWRINPDARRIADKLRKGKFDMLYLNNQPSSNLEGLLAAELAGIPVVQHCRIEATLNETEVKTLNRIASRVVCVSHGVAETLTEQGVDGALCSVVLNGVDGNQVLPSADTVRQIPELAAAAVVVGTVGSLVPRKGIRALLDALQNIADGSVRGLIVGDGPQRDELENAARNQGVSKQVVFTGFQREPLHYLAAMDIFCLLSAREGLPRVILEAMLLGKPVIATDIPGSRELVRNGETGFLVPLNDEKALLDALTQLIRDPGLRARMGQRGREIVLADYSIERYVQGVEQVFEEAFGNARAKAYA